MGCIRAQVTGKKEKHFANEHFVLFNSPPNSLKFYTKHNINFITTARCSRGTKWWNMILADVETLFENLRLRVEELDSETERNRWLHVSDSQQRILKFWHWIKSFQDAQMSRYHLLQMLLIVNSAKYINLACRLV